MPGSIHDLKGERPSARGLHLRFHALYLLEELKRFKPRLVGDLTVPQEDLPFFEGIELEVAPDHFAAASIHLRALGYRIEPIQRGEQRGIEAELLERIVVWSRREGAPRGLDHDELEALVGAVYGDQCVGEPVFRRY